MNPLDQLKDIHLPQAVSYWPPAWPWWVLVITLIVLIALLVRYKKRQAWRKQALTQLSQFNWQQPQQAYRDTNKLLKQISIQKLNAPCAHLSGQAWLTFLDTQMKTPLFLPQLRPFAHVLDEPNIELDSQALQKAAQHWIRKVKC